MIRVLKKSKETFLCVNKKGMKTEIPTEEFNKLFVKTDKPYIYKPTEETKKKFEVTNKKFEFLSKIYPSVLITQNNFNLQDAFNVGNGCEEYCKKFNCSPKDFIEDMKMYQDYFQEVSIRNFGVSFDENHHNIPKHLKKMNEKNKIKIEKEEQVGEQNLKKDSQDKKKTKSTMTIGEILKAKQKEK